MRQTLFETPLFGVVVTLAAYVGASALRSAFRPLRALPALPFATALVIALLQGFSIPYESYRLGGDGVQFFLGPVTVMLALPLYHQRALLARHRWPLLIGAACGALTAVVSVLLLSRLCGLDPVLARPLLVKSVSIPFGLEISRHLGGDPGLAVLGITLTGILGVSIAPWLCGLFRVKDPVAQGAAIGACSHALGTARALEMGEMQGATSGVALCLTGIFTVFIAAALRLLGWL
ncbi:MAG: LrgB family protein [Puniceicoccales bacterium]|jgi:putative effector of murein hydrolase|nr:LrgB family protein [Puniceicoccales bacterium]